jgi:threonine dehydrogenase-like Zn-dependent dehydrogenase
MSNPDESPRPGSQHDVGIAAGLGWFSLGLGAAQLLAPGALNRLAGIHDDAAARAAQRLVGVREVGAFAAIMAGRPRPVLALWSRVGGDLIDLALLGRAWEHKRESAPRLALTIGNIAAVTGLDAYAAIRHTRAKGRREPKAEGNGYSHMLGGYPGGQAEAARVPFADVGPLKIESDIPDEEVLFLSDILPTGYMGAEMADIQPGDVIAVWGAGPVGQFAVASAKMLGAERVIAIDRFDYRLRMALEKAGADEVIDYEEQPDVVEELKERTGGRRPDACIDAVGMEAHHAHGAVYAYDRVKQAARMETERPYALREAILACRSGGVVSIIGVYGGFADKFPIGAVMNRSLTLRSGQCHVQKYMRPLLERIEAGDIDPSFVITHKMSLDEVPNGYETFKHKQDGCVKVVLKP